MILPSFFIIITERMMKMQKIKTIMYVIMAISTITMVATTSMIITLINAGIIILSAYNIYLIRRTEKNA